MKSLFHSSPDSHRPEIGKSLSEAFSNSFSARDAIPEQHRAHFDELKNGILSFCREFDIPVETLRNKETFGRELTSKQIPADRMEEAVLLFQQLEHLVTHGEPLKETRSEYLKDAERLYHLREQYDAQVALLEEAGILKEGAIMGIDGNIYPVPTYEQIVESLFFPELRDFYETKYEQGFAKLLLVPFGMSLDSLIDAFAKFLMDYKGRHPDFDLGTLIPIFEDQYRGADTSHPARIVYHPQIFFDKGHRGETKAQILEDDRMNQYPFLGWKVRLFQSFDPSNPRAEGFAPIPKEAGRTCGKKIPRPDREAGRNPHSYLSTLLQTQGDPESPYYGEVGMTPEDWMLACMVHVQETGEPLDNRSNEADSLCYLIGAFFPREFPSGNSVPEAHWNGQAKLFKRGDTINHSEIGIRTSITI